MPFARMKEEILGKRYRLSLVFAGDALSRSLNKRYRKKDKVANILSFPMDKKEGEIFINLKEARKDAPLFKKSYNAFVAHLFIHGCLHLKGLAHGSKMEALEKSTLRKFGL